MTDSAPARKRLRLLDATMIIMGSMIGSGIFLAPALIAAIALQGQLGAGSFVWIWIVGGVLTLCAALSFAELAAAFPKTGGQYVFLSEALNPFFGFLYGWTLFTVIQCGFIAAVAVAFANYLGVFVPWVSQSSAVLSAGPLRVSSVQIVAILLVAALSWINSRGLREGAAVQNLLGFAKIGGLIGLVVFGLTSSRGDWSHFQPLLPSAVTFGVLTAFAVGLSKALFAYDSWNVVTFVAEETHEPARTLPRALFLGTLGVTLIYALTTSAYLYILPIDQAANVADQRIAAEVAQIVLGPVGLTLIALAVLISTAGCDNGLILSGPWLYYAMAKDGLFFGGAARLDEKRGMPIRSLQYQAVWSMVLILSGSLGSRGAQLYSDLLTFTSFASLLFNALTVMGLLMLRKNRPELPRPYRVTGYPAVPLLFLIAAIFFLIFIAVGDPRNSGFGLLIIVSGVPLYVYWKRKLARKLAAVAMTLVAGVALGQQPPLVQDYVKGNVGPLPSTLALDPFYKKYTGALGIPITSSEKVPDAALLVARDIVIHMLAKRPDVRAELVKKNWRIGVMAQTEMTTDIPEHRNLKKPRPDAFNLTAGERANYERIEKMTDKEYWDGRARGLGGNPTTCAEENVLGYPGTRYYGEHILVHEFSHAILNGGVRAVDPKLYEEVREAYKEAMAKGLWKGHYGSTNFNEYWAEGTQTWYWSNYEFFDGAKRVQTPGDLKVYDPRLYELLGRVYEDHHIPMDIYHGKNIRPARR
ncbi:MAG: amino acid permease [Bryobacteraceae bacterium]